jgi:hypothetical protein
MFSAVIGILKILGAIIFAYLLLRFSPSILPNSIFGEFGGIISLCVSGFVLIFILASIVKNAKEVDYQRGENLIHPLQAKLLSIWKTRNDQHPFFWGGLWLPFSTGVKGMVAVGAPGSGKTITIRLFLQSVIHLVGKVSDHRAIIYDAKQDIFQILSGIGLDVSVKTGLVKTLNPYDERSFAWDISRDVSDIQTADEISLVFIPKEDTKDPVWQNAARQILQGVLESFILSGSTWTLRDVCATTRKVERLKAVLNAHEHTRGLVSELEKGKTTDSILFELRTHIKPFEIIASLWEKLPAERTVSLEEWLNDKNGTILLLGAGEEGTALGKINQLIIKRLGQLISRHQKNSDTRRTWIVIDEIRQCGRLDLSPIATMGRSKGASLIIGFQDKDGLNDSYTKDVSNELLGMCQHKAIFSLSTASTAAWASGEIGTQEVLENEVTKERPVVLPSEFTSRKHTPETTFWNGLTGYYKSVSIGAYKKRIIGARLFGYEPFVKPMLSPIDESIEGFIKRDKSEQIFKDWTEAEEQQITKSVKEEPISMSIFEKNDRKVMLMSESERNELERKIQGER